MRRSSIAGLPLPVRGTDTGTFYCDVPAAAFVTGEVELPWKEGVHEPEGRPTGMDPRCRGDGAWTCSGRLVLRLA